MPAYRLSQHGLGIVFKLEAEQLGTALGRRFGLNLPPIVRHFPTELPVADVHLEQLDTVFELADADLLHLEAQTVHRREDLHRFLQYDVSLGGLYHRRIRTVVFYGAGITTAPDALDYGAVQYTVTNVFLGREDGEATYRRLQARLASGAGLAPEERLDLVFLPLMPHVRPALEVVTGSLALAQQLPEEEQRQTLAALIGLGQRFLEPAEIEALLEGLMATSIGERLFERGRTASKREDVLMVVTTRFGAAPPSLQEQLQRIDDMDRLEELLQAAAKATTVEEFMQALS